MYKQNPFFKNEELDLQGVLLYLLGFVELSVQR